MFDSLTDGDLIEVITAAHRAEAQACARRLGAIGVLVDRYADLDKPDERDHRGANPIRPPPSNNRAT